MKKIRIEATIDEDKIAFVIQKTKNMDRIEVAGLLNFVSNEVLDGLGEKLKIEKPS